MTEHREQLESVLDYIINNEHVEAESLLHDIIVEKARDIYASLVEEEDDLLDEESVEEEDEKVEESEKDEEIDEAFGDDQKGDLFGKVKAKIDTDSEEIDAEQELEGETEEDPMGDFEPEAGEEGEEMEGGDEVVDRLEDIEAAIAELTAEFEEVFGDEMSGDDMGMEPGMDEPEMPGDLELDQPADDGMGELEFDDMEEAALAEATAFLKDFSVSMKDEGNEAGTGGKVPVNDKSTHSTSKRPNHGGEPVDFAGGADEKGFKASGAKDDTPEDNVDVDTKSAPSVQRKPTGEDKAAKSLLTGAPKKTK